MSGYRRRDRQRHATKGPVARPYSTVFLASLCVPMYCPRLHHEPVSCSHWPSSQSRKWNDCANVVIDSANDSWKSLSSLAELIEPQARNRADFIEECKIGCFDEVLAIYRTFESVETTGRFDEEVVSALPPSVKFICHNGMRGSFASAIVAR